MAVENGGGFIPRDISSIGPVGPQGESLAKPMHGIHNPLTGSRHPELGMQAAVGEGSDRHVPREAAHDLTPHEAISPIGGEASEVSGMITPTTGHTVELLNRPNHVTDFVIDSISSYSELNADTLEEGKWKFNDAMAYAVEDATLHEHSEQGGMYKVYTVEGNDNLLVKRFYAGRNTVGSDRVVEAAQKFAVHKQTHQSFQEAFGREHIPDTEFVVTYGVNVGESDPDFLEESDFLMVQERIEGIEYEKADTDTLPQLQEAAVDASDAMKEQVGSFVNRYRALQAQGVVPEDQVLFDFTADRVTLVDTNNPGVLTREVGENGYVADFHPNPSDIQTPAQLLDFVLTADPELEALQGRPVSEVQPLVTRESELIRNVKERMDAQGEYAPDFHELIRVLETFPVEGDNQFIRSIVDAGLTPERSEQHGN